MQQWFIHASLAYPFLVYGLIILFACAEGPILSIIFGILLKLGYFYFIPVYASLMVGDLIGDVGWYWIGRKFGHGFIHRFGKYFNITEDKVEKVTELFHRYKHSILFISKISNGFGFALITLMTAGMVRIPFARYLVINLSGQLIWTGLLLGVGFFFSQMYTTATNIFEQMTVVAGFVVLVVIFIGFSKYLRKRAGM